MKLPLLVQGFEGRDLFLSIRFIGDSKISIDGNPLPGKKGTFIVQDNAGREVTIVLKKHWIDRVPQIEIDHVPLNICPPLTWYDRLIIGFPLFLTVISGFIGGFIGLLGSLLTLRVFRSLGGPTTRYSLTTLTSLVIVGSFLFYWVNTSSHALLDHSLKQDIEAYTDGIETPWKENNILYAMQLDQQGRQLLSEGKDQEVYDIYRKVLNISYQQGSLQGIMNSLMGLSSVFEHMDNDQEALKAAKLAYKVGKLMNNPYEYGLVELQLARLVGHDSRRLQVLWRMKAKESLKETPYGRDYVGLLNVLAGDLYWLGLTDEARQFYEEAHERSQHLGQAADHKWTRWDVALAYGRMLKNTGACEQAIEVIQNALSMFTSQERESFQYSYLLTELAQCAVKLDQQELAKRTFLQAYASYELQRSRKLGDHARARLDTKHTRLINGYINFLLEQNESSAALALLETNKARTLSDIREDMNQKDVYTRIHAQEEQQARQVVELAEQWKRANADLEVTDRTWDEYLQLINDQEKERRKLHIQLQLRDIPVSKSLTKQDIRVLQSDLGPESAVLSYFVSQKHIGIFLLTHNDIRYIPTTFSYSDFTQTIAQLRLALSNEYTEHYQEPSRRLYKHLFLPVKKYLKPTVTHLVYSPDDKLFHIPLGVLSDGKDFLTEHYALTRIPSLRFLNPEHHMTPIQLTGGITCVDPAVKHRRLPFQLETDHLLQTLFRGNMASLTGDRCSPRHLEESVESSSRDGFLHIGAHGSFYDLDPMKSGIALSSDKSNGSSVLWDARAIARLDLRHLQLVTLSSCETGLKDHNRLRDVFGIMRGLFFGGAQQVIAPLWSVQDRATAHLIQEFYKNLATNGKTAQSLQQAQQALIHQGKFRHPYYWAGFILTNGPV